MNETMHISPDSIVYMTLGFFELNATIVFSWVVMALLCVLSWLATRNLTAGKNPSRWQLGMEFIVRFVRNQIRNITHRDPDPFLFFIGTLFLFILTSNLLAPVPGYHPPTGSLMTTGGLALIVFFGVPVYGIINSGVPGFLKHYIQPSVFMLPFNIISEFSRTLAMAVRLFGNIMSGTLIGATLISLVPFVIPVVMDLFGLLVGVIQAYIFAVLATVYIASGIRAEEQTGAVREPSDAGGGNDGTRGEPNTDTA